MTKNNQILLSHERKVLTQTNFLKTKLFGAKQKNMGNSFAKNVENLCSCLRIEDEIPNQSNRPIHSQNPGRESYRSKLSTHSQHGVAGLIQLWVDFLF